MQPAFVPARPLLLITASHETCKTSKYQNGASQVPVHAPRMTPPPLLCFHHLPPVPPLASHISVIWLRRDLRIDDHPALREAVHSGALIAPLYVHDGRPTDFVLAALRSLRSALRARGAELFVRRANGDSGRAVGRFCAEVGAAAVYMHRETGRAERAQEKSMAESLGSGVRVEGLWSNALVGVDELPFEVSELPAECDAYARRVAGVGVGRPIVAPDRVRGLTGQVRSGRIAGAGDGGERVGMIRVREFCNGGLAVVRNGKVGTGFARLGRFVEEGCVSARRVYWEVLDRVGEQCVRRYCMEFELVWRDFRRLERLRETGTVGA